MRQEMYRALCLIFVVENCEMYLDVKVGRLMGSKKD